MTLSSIKPNQVLSSSATVKAIPVAGKRFIKPHQRQLYLQYKSFVREWHQQQQQRAAKSTAHSSSNKASSSAAAMMMDREDEANLMRWVLLRQRQHELQLQQQQQQLGSVSSSFAHQQRQRQLVAQQPQLPNVIVSQHNYANQVWKKTDSDPMIYQDSNVPHRLLHVIPNDEDDNSNDAVTIQQQQQQPAPQQQMQMQPLRRPAPLTYVGIPLAGSPTFPVPPFAASSTSSTTAHPPKPRFLVRPRFPNEVRSLNHMNHMKQATV